MKILLDTDIGTDIDDAVCLAYLLAQPECELLGITTVSGEVEKRAMLASALCKVAGKDVPIYPGTEKPLLVNQRQPEAQQAVVLAKWPHETHFPANEAVDFLRRTIRQHPGEITLLTIGPVTNIALLFALDPEIPHLLKELVMMIGVYTEFERWGDLEWNAMLDPHAAAMVFRAPVPRLRAIGLNVTRRVVLNAADVTARFTTPVLQAVLDFAQVWFAERPDITFHDPLAGAIIFDDSYCDFLRGTVEVDSTTGLMHWTPGAGRHDIAVNVDSQRFFAHYFSMFKA
ncbi:MAG: nucleoside hydrolase [Anaerolineae bacterium]